MNKLKNIIVFFIIALFLVISFTDTLLWITLGLIGIVIIGALIIIKKTDDK